MLDGSKNMPGGLFNNSRLWLLIWFFSVVRAGNGHFSSLPGSSRDQLIPHTNAKTLGVYPTDACCAVCCFMDASFRGSISKQFTATAIMLLVEERKIGLDDRVTNYFGWLPKEWGEVTVRHLLTHTSGIREQQWKDGIIEFDRFEHDQEEVVRTAFGPMLVRPGEKFAYSNVGYRLLGMLIEKASGQSYWDFLEQRIFRRIGMEVTRNSDPKTIIPNRARGYGISGGNPENREPVTASAAFSQGALISSVLDMVKWDAALDSERLLKRTSLDQMWTPVRLNDGTTYNYGFGWYLRPVPGHRTVAHGGGLPGFSTFIRRFIDDKLTVILLSNCETADTGRIALGVAGLYVPALVSPEVKKQL